MELAEALITIELLQGQLLAFEQQVAERDEQICALQFELQLKSFEIARYKQRLFGDSSERLVPEAPLLPGMELLAAPVTLPEKPTRVKEHERKPRTQPARTRLELDPSCVTDQHITLWPEVRRCPCCGELLITLSEELRVVIERQPAHYIRTTYHRPNTACGRCGQAGVQIAPAPEPTVTGAGPVGLTLAVDTVLMHYQDHQPFHRMQGILAREGLQIDRSTLSRVSGRVADLLKPLVDCMESDLLSSDNVVGIDGTGLKILASPHCKRRLVYVLHGMGSVIFRALTGESADQVLEGFESFEGIVLGDAAKVHLGRHSQSLGLRVALCGAHARRKYYEARDTDKARSSHALSFYRQVALLERQWKGLDAQARQRERAEHLKPLFEEFHRWLVEESVRVMSRTPMHEAIQYSLNHWAGLTLFLEDGRIPWTNNESERHLRHLVVGRKNFVFRGSDKGAERACVLWSLMMSCRVNRVNPRAYLLETLQALATVNVTGIPELTPRAYALRQRPPATT